ncbi:hypothetical protein [Rheinheimera aquimaris]|nr:hypothetical protein [Rheinheimera aquimaris]
MNKEVLYTLTNRRHWQHFSGSRLSIGETEYSCQPAAWLTQ